MKPLDWGIAHPRWLALPFLALVAACGGDKKPLEIRIPVPVPCVAERPARPDYPVIKDGDSIFVRVQKLLAERELRRAYEGELEAALAACG
jgi:hypothetical protein